MIRDDLAHAVRRALADAALPEPPSGVVLDPPQASAITATGPRPSRSPWPKAVGGNPLEIAERIAAALEAADVPHLARAEVAPARLRQPLPRAHVAARRAARRWSPPAIATAPPTRSPASAINLEFVSANPTGPLHAGGGRWVAVGDAIANLLAAQGARGAPRVLPERHRQPARDVPRLAVRAVPRRGSRPRTATRASTSSTWPTTCAPSSATTCRPTTRASGACGASSRASATTSARIGVHFDTWFSERTLHERGEVADVLRVLDERGVVFDAGRRALVALDRLRRLARPRARAVRRHHDLSLQRPRVPPRQVRARLQPPHRHLGRRPPRSGEVAAGRHGGARLRAAARARGAARSAREAGARRRGGPALEARRQHRHARRHPRRGRSRRRAHDVPAAGHRLARRRSTSTSSRRSRWRTPSTTCSTRTRGSSSIARRAAEAGVDARAARVGRPRRRSRTSARPSCCARSRCIPTSSPTRPRRARRRRSARGCATSPRAFHGFYRDCRVITDDAELTQARLWLAEACRIGLANALGPARRERARRDGAPRRRRRRRRDRRAMS